MFYLLSAFILVTGLLAVTTGKIFRSAIWLLFSLTGIAGIYFWLQMEFIAAVQIVVYVGGIVVLILFSIFLTQQAGSEMPKVPGRRSAFAGMAAGFGLAFICTLLREYHFDMLRVPHAGTVPGVPAVSARTAIEPSVANIGVQMLSTTEHGYIIPFEVISILLLAAMVGCIVIAIKTKPGSHA